MFLSGSNYAQYLLINFSCLRLGQKRWPVFSKFLPDRHCSACINLRPQYSIAYKKKAYPTDYKTGHTQCIYHSEPKIDRWVNTSSASKSLNTNSLWPHYPYRSVFTADLSVKLCTYITCVHLCVPMVYQSTRVCARWFTAEAQTKWRCTNLSIRRDFLLGHQSSYFLWNIQRVIQSAHSATICIFRKEKI